MTNEGLKKALCDTAKNVRIPVPAVDYKYPVPGLGLLQ